MNKFSITSIYLVYLLKSVVRDKTVSAPGGDVDWVLLYKLAQMHNVSNVVGYAIEGTEFDIPQNIKTAFGQEKLKSIVQETKQTAIAEEILTSLEDRNIKVLPLKGYFMRNFYPQRDMRSMCDLDVLIQYRDMPEAEKIMQGMGFPIREEGGHEVVYKKPPYLSVELHHSLVTPDESDPIYVYYKKIWDKVSLCDNKKLVYKMTEEDFYIYSIVHLARHYRKGGGGLRAFLDIYIYINKHSLDARYLESQLEQLGLLDFEKKMRNAAFCWFGDQQCDDLSKKILSYILTGGTYGSKDRCDVSENITSDGNISNLKIGKLKKMRRVLFPSYFVMTKLYPCIKGKPYIVPVFWIVRFINRALFHRDRVSQAMVISDDVKVASDMAKHLADVGLIKK